MQPPPGYSVPDGMVCRTRSSLYGLKQVPCAWFENFASVVIAAGFSPSAHDPDLFVHTPRGWTLFLYVDDMIITADESEYIAFVKARLHEQFLMSDLGPLCYFFGIKVSSNFDGFYISQEKTFLLPLWSTIATFLFYNIFVAQSLTVFSSLAPAPFSSGPTQMLRGRVICLIAIRSLLILFLCGPLIAWKTKKQTAVSRSSAEAELSAMALLTAEVTWLCQTIEVLSGLRVTWFSFFSTSTDMPLGTAMHTIEITRGRGGQLARAAGAGVFQVMVDGFIHGGTD
uniref:Uncharacterized protein n=1 Tax=Avena sativa TaxID=4498 RepID=A0ACD5XV69_AVESA